jgi:uncharacterized membrane protein YbhN (UPF0104 family)
VSVFAGAGILVLLGFQLGAEPFVDAVRSIDAVSVLLALGITAGTTWCCTHRWILLADRLDVGVSAMPAFRAYYRAQFLNSTLPSGVLGEVDRAIWHGHSSKAMARGIRSVLWDRSTGQIVLFGLVVLTIPALAPPVRTWMLWLLLAAAVLVGLGSMIRSKFIRAFWAEARAVPGARGVWPRILLLSVLALSGHVAIFIVAARAVGVSAPTLSLIPVGLVVLQASSIPLNIAGWGPREGVTALIFGASGLGADAGLATSVAFGVLCTIAALPGVLALRRRQAAQRAHDQKGGPRWASARTPS